MSFARRRAVRVEDADDPRLAPYTGTRRPEQLRGRGCVLIEGRFVVRRLFESGRVRFVSLLLNETASRGFEDVASRAADVDIYVAPSDVLHAITGFKMHRGCLAIAGRPVESPMAALVVGARLVLVLERVADPDNIGGLFRNAEAFGVDAVLLSPGCGDPLYRKAIRTSSGATLLVPWSRAEPWPHAIDALRAAGFAIVALTPQDDAMAIGTFVGTRAAGRPLAVLMGTEGSGLSSEALAAADVRVCIPMTRGRAAVPWALDSLNIATAAGIALQRLHEARRASAAKEE